MGPVTMKLVLRLILLLTATCLSVDATNKATLNTANAQKAVLENRHHQHSLHQRSDRLLVPNAMPEQQEVTHSISSMHVRGGISSSFVEKLTICVYFLAWYALNVVYNSKFLSISRLCCCYPNNYYLMNMTHASIISSVSNKKVLNQLPAPLIVGTFQFLVGGLYCSLLWFSGLRAMPKLTPAGKNAVKNVGIYHSFGQLATMVSLGAGAVSFTHIVKAMEPFFSAMVAGLYWNKWMKPQVYMTLIPVVCGVGYACLKELNFSWLAFGAAMSSNLFFALRAVMSKLALTSDTVGANLTPPNMFGLVTWAAFFISIPIALIGEGKEFPDLWQTALSSTEGNKNHQFLKLLFLSGLSHYLNNEVMYLALGKVHPVTLAVGNTMKRVFILVASVMVFRNPITIQAGIGSGVGMAGVLLYSLTKQHYETTQENQSLAESSNKGGRRRRA